MSEYQVLDATCGGRMGWIQKEDPNALYMDIRIRAPGFMEQRPNFEVMPDIQGDFTAIPFAAAGFNLVYYDPPHVIRKEINKDSWVTMKYGNLVMETWKETILDGLMECWRVLKTGGCLIFKWSDVDYAGALILERFPISPLFGSRHGKNNNTIWYCFYKPNNGSLE